MSPTMTVRRSSETFESKSDNISFEPQCTRVSFEEIHCSLHVLAIVCETWHHDLSTAEYDVETLDNSPPASVIRAAVYAACCSGVIFTRVANATSFWVIQQCHKEYRHLFHYKLCDCDFVKY